MAELNEDMEDAFATGDDAEGGPDGDFLSLELDLDYEFDASRYFGFSLGAPPSLSHYSSTSYSIVRSRDADPVGSTTQDWEMVVLNRRKPKAADLSNPKAVNQALRAGASVETVKKHDAGSNKKGSSAAARPAVNARKLDEQTELAALDRVPVDVRQAIRKVRVAKKMSQADLAKAICEKPQVDMGAVKSAIKRWLFGLVLSLKILDDFCKIH